MDVCTGMHCCVCGSEDLADKRLSSTLVSKLMLNTIPLVAM